MRPDRYARVLTTTTAATATATAGALRRQRLPSPYILLQYQHHHPHHPCGHRAYTSSARRQSKSILAARAGAKEGLWVAQNGSSLISPAVAVRLSPAVQLLEAENSLVNRPAKQPVVPKGLVDCGGGAATTAGAAATPKTTATTTAAGVTAAASLRKKARLLQQQNDDHRREAMAVLRARERERNREGKPLFWIENISSPTTSSSSSSSTSAATATSTSSLLSPPPSFSSIPASSSMRARAAAAAAAGPNAANAGDGPRKSRPLEHALLAKRREVKDAEEADQTPARPTGSGRRVIALLAIALALPVAFDMGRKSEAAKHYQKQEAQRALLSDPVGERNKAAASAPAAASATAPTATAVMMMAQHEQGSETRGLAATQPGQVGVGAHYPTTASIGTSMAGSAPGAAPTPDESAAQQGRRRSGNGWFWSSGP